MVNRVKKSIFVFITLALLLGVIEGISWMGVWWLEKYRGLEYQPLELAPLSPKYHRSLISFVHGESPYSQFSTTLGWKTHENMNVHNGGYITNSVGARHDREFSLLPDSHVTRIATFGESYTEGGEVVNNDTWQEQLMRFEPAIEAINFGVGGHGLDQVYLRYLEEGGRYSEQIVMIGYMTENINRIVNVYVPFYVGERAGAPVTKPRFLLESGKLKLLPNPMQNAQDYMALLEHPKQLLPQLGRYDDHYNAKYISGQLDVFSTVRLAKIGTTQLRANPIYTRRGEYNTQSDAFRLLQQLFKEFYRTALNNNVVPIVLIYPDYFSIVPFYEHKIRIYHHLTDWLEANDYLYLDLLEPILELGKHRPIKDYFTNGVGHYRPYGNELVARAVQHYLVEMRLTDPRERKSIISELKVKHLKALTATK